MDGTLSKHGTSVGRKWLWVSFTEENDSELLFCLPIVELIVIHSVFSLHCRIIE